MKLSTWNRIHFRHLSRFCKCCQSLCFFHFISCDGRNMLSLNDPGEFLEMDLPKSVRVSSLSCLTSALCEKPLSHPFEVSLTPYDSIHICVCVCVCQRRFEECNLWHVIISFRQFPFSRDLVRYHHTEHYIVHPFIV